MVAALCVWWFHHTYSQLTSNQSTYMQCNNILPLWSSSGTPSAGAVMTSKVAKYATKSKDSFLQKGSSAITPHILNVSTIHFRFRDCIDSLISKRFQYFVEVSSACTSFNGYHKNPQYPGPALQEAFRLRIYCTHFLVMHFYTTIIVLSDHKLQCQWNGMGN